jgi:O-antigen ligase
MIDTWVHRKQLDLYLMVALGLFFIGMFKMPLLMSIGTMAVCTIAMIGVANKVYHFHFQWIYALGVAFYAWMLLSYGWSEDTEYFFERMRIKLPIFVCCLSCFWLGKLPSQGVHRLLGIMLIIMLGSTLPSLFEYLQHKEFYDLQYLYGNTIPIPFSSHIRYGLMLVVAFQWAVYLYIETRAKMYWLALAYLFFFIHLLAVRSALLTLYLSLILLAVYYVIISKRYFRGLAVLCILIMSLIIAYYQVDSFRNKINYTQWGITQLMNNQKSESSDEGRFISLRYGIELIKNAPWFGVGEGDIRREMTKKYEAAAQQGRVYALKLPHSQFIWTWAGSGFIGFILLIAFLSACLREAFIRKNICMMMFIFTVMGSMMVEHTWETQLGIAFFILPFLIYTKMES